MNSRGETVGTSVDSSGNSHGFLLSRGTSIAIDFPGAILTDANGINARGDIVGDFTDTSGNEHGYLLSR
jgi:hypothetical protein